MSYLRRIVLPHDSWLRLWGAQKTQVRLVICPKTAEWGTGNLNWSRFDFTNVFVDPGGTEFFGPGPYLKVSRPDDVTRHRLYPRFQVGDVMRLRSHLYAPGENTYVSAKIETLGAQRLNDISEEDAEREGMRDLAPCEECPCEGPLEDPGPTHLPQCRWSHVDIEPDDEPCKAAFAVEWDLAHGKTAPWSSNPWVWVLSFKSGAGEMKLHGGSPA